MPEFVHLHVHSEYSLLDGLGRIDALVSRARELGMKSLALTDHGVLYGAIPFYKAANAAGLKPIVGCEVYIAPRGMERREPRRDANPYHLVLLARDRAGYQNLLQLVTKSHLEGFYYKPRVDRKLLEKHAAGLLALSGCASGEIPRLLLEGNEGGARASYGWYRDCFGPGGFYLELQEHHIPELANLNRELVRFAQGVGAPLVATNDVHYVDAADAPVQDLLLCIQTNSIVDDPRRLRMRGDGYHLRSAAEMAELFAELPEALENSLRIAEECALVLDFGKLHIPRFTVSDGFTAGEFLERLAREGLARRYPRLTPDIEGRLGKELALIHQMKLDDYFLIHWDIIGHAKRNGIMVGPGRGSVVGSLVSYALGITNVDPLENGLIFERFLNPGRAIVPDIDMDFVDDRRDEMIEYAVRKYGQDRVAQIITFGTMAARAAVRDTGRALGLPLGEVDRVAKAIPFGMGIAEALEAVPELRELCESRDYLAQLVSMARNLEGVVRHASTHAAGVVITDEPLTEYVPLQRAPKGEGVITQYSMEPLVEDLGLLKMDFLGLSTLTILRRALENIEKARGITLTPDDIPLDDPAIYELLSSGEVAGIFQVESSGMRRILKEMKPSRFSDVTALIALYRPGPMQNIDEFIRRKRGEVPIEYLHPRLEPILAETYGIAIYQEQIIQMAIGLAGFTASEADMVRWAMGKKKADLLERQRDHFLRGAQERGIEGRLAEEIFAMMEHFAGYGFNKSHSAAYAVLTCQTAYLKAKYPLQYMAALLTTEKANSDRVALGVAECQRLGIAVFPPDVNRSFLDFVVEGEAIRFGLGAVKNVGEAPIRAILGARAAGGEFASLDDFCRRVDLRQVNRRALECLIKVGALDAFGRREQVLAAVERMLSTSLAAHQAREIGQLSMFDGPSARSEVSFLAPLAEAGEVPQREKLAWEKELLGVYISEHPLQHLAKELEGAVTAFCGQVDPSMAGQKVVLAGMVAGVRTITTRRGDPMAFVRLEDIQGEVEVVVFPDVYAATREAWRADKVLLVRGRVDDRDGVAKVICEEASLYDGAPPDQDGFTVRKAGQCYHLYITIPRSGSQEKDAARLGEVYELLVSNPGQDRFTLHVSNGHSIVALDFPNNTTGHSLALDRALVQMLGAGTVRAEAIS